MKRIFYLLILVCFIFQAKFAFSQNACSTAVNITVKSASLDCFSGFTSVATTDIGSIYTPAGSCGTADDEEWWATFTATDDTTEFFMWGKDKDNASFIVYSGTCSALTPINCFNTNVDNIPMWGMTATVPGQQYYILVHKKMTIGRLCVYSTKGNSPKPYCTDDASFENGGSNGWTGKYGSYHLVSSPGTNFMYDMYNTGKPANMYAITSGNGRDPNVGMLSVVAPEGGNYSFRLGTLSTAEGAAGTVNGISKQHAATSEMTYCFAVSSANAGFGYKYATVMDNPSHPAVLQPQFDVFLTAQGTGDTVPCGKFTHYPTDGVSPFYYVGDDGDVLTNNDICFTPWTDVMTDLSGYVGKNVCVTFRVRDCEGGRVCSGSCPSQPPYDTSNTYGTHWAYTYFDTYCTAITLEVPEFCAGDTSILICAPKGYMTYNWPAGQSGLTGSPTTRCVTVKNPVPGTFYTVNMTTIAGCIVTVNVPIQTIPIDIAASDTLICPGGSATLTADVPNGVNPPYAYNWSNGLGSNSTVIVSPTSATTYTVTVSNGKGCVATKTIKVSIGCQPPTVVVNPQTVCPGGCANISATTTNGTSPFTYTWSPSVGSGPGPHNVCPTSNMVYTVTVTDKNGNSATDTTIVSVGSALNLTTASTPANCGSTNGSATVTVNGGTAPFTYLWSNNGTNSTITNIGGGSYTVTVTDSKGCSNVSVVNVNNSGAPSVAITNTNVLCNGAKNGTATATPSGGSNPYTYSWNTSPVQNTSISTGLSAGTYTVTITDASGCTAFQTVTITQPSPLAINAGTDNSICSGGSTIIGGSPTGPSGSTFSWSPGTGLNNPSSSNPSANPVATTTYTVTVTDGNGCTAVDQVTVIVNIPPVVSFTAPDSVCRTHNGQVVYTGTSGSGTTYQWDFGGGSPSSGSTPGPHNVNWPTFGVKRIYVTVTNPGCPSVSDSMDVIIRNCETIIPNIFTPNGDGPNDKFYIVNIDKYPGSRIVIYNRWGLKIYESNAYLNDWDGRHYKTLNRLNDGVYYYILYRSDGEDFHGFVTLLRGEKF